MSCASHTILDWIPAFTGMTSGIHGDGLAPLHFI